MPSSAWKGSDFFWSGLDPDSPVPCCAPVAGSTCISCIACAKRAFGSRFIARTANGSWTATKW